MKNSIYSVLALAGFLCAPCFFGGTKDVSAKVNLNINLNLGAEPPQEVIAAPDDVYFVPAPNADVFFYGGFWWASRENHWYRSSDYNGNWVGVDQRNVPAPVFRTYRVPHYRDVYGKKREKHIPYGQWKKDRRGGMGREGRGGPREHGNQGRAQEKRWGQGDHGDQGRAQEKHGGQGDRGDQGAAGEKHGDSGEQGKQGKHEEKGGKDKKQEHGD